jgi:hypothetical protein
VLPKVFPIVADHPEVISPVAWKHHLRIKQQQQRRRDRQNVGHRQENPSE